RAPRVPRGERLELGGRRARAVAIAGDQEDLDLRRQITGATEWVGRWRARDGTFDRSGRRCRFAAREAQEREPRLDRRTELVRAPEGLFCAGSVARAEPQEPELVSR